MIRILCLLFFVPVAGFSQFSYQFDQSIPVSVNGQELEMPWAGGINAAQYNTIDLNNDNAPDLVIFDRSTNKISTFLAVNSSYEYAPEYAVIFPSEITNWIKLLDYNCDGKKDILASSPFGVITYLNIGDTIPQWEVDVDPVTTLGTSGIINLKINGDDIPAITDMDGDGDLDIITFGFTGAGEIQFHKNMSVENLGTCGMGEFVRTHLRWGDVKECGCGEFTYGMQECPAGGRTEHAGGKSLLAFDADGDGDHDLLIGEENCNQLHLLTNVGDDNDVVLRNASIYPKTNPVSLYHYPTAYLEDVTFDGVKDLLVSTNYPSNPQNSIDFEHTSWLYANTANDAQPNFLFVQEDFLQGQMLDIGENCVPAFFDVDGDGDLDMLLTHRGRAKSLVGYLSYVALFENAGTASSPEFALKEEDYLGLSDLRFTQTRLQYADINADGTEDLMITGIPRDGYAQVVVYLANNSAVKFDFQGNSLEQLPLYFNPNEAGFFHDLDDDGFADLLLGKVNGNLEYYRSNGNPGDFQFELLDEAFYGLDVSFTNRVLVPSVADLNTDNQPELITMDGAGELTIYRSFMEHLNNPEEGQKNVFYNALLNNLDTASLGTWNWPAVADLYRAGAPSVFLGSVQGGVRVLKNKESPPPGSFDPSSLLTIYPNPGGANISKGEVYLQSTEDVVIDVISVLGNRVLSGIALHKTESYILQTNKFLPGLYLLLVNKEGKVKETKRLVIVE